MKKLFRVLLAAFLVSSLAMGAFAWDWPWNKKDENKLSIQGSTTVLPIAQKAAEEFMKDHPNIEVTVRGGGSGVGIAALVDGAVDIGDASRPIKTKEIIAAKQGGVNPTGTVVAKDGIAVAVNPSNSISRISIDQLQGIYCGRITKWSDLGGPDEPIVVVSRDSASGTFEVFNKLVLKGKKLRDDAIMTVSNREAGETIKNTKGAVGYIGLAYISDAVKVLAVNGVKPSNRTVVSGAYKLARPLFMYTDGEPSGLAKKFIDFVMSPEGQRIAKEVGYVPVK